ncbi:hypothetical protein L873DRAFT_1802027 [Choiromyces venosus 120613-1]|uniref:BRCT domain-containing protein n=1 Tax=Choiromyces venosus 120613-1 TaxID=1336337 RepID=A0A3N4JW38_9PEZI|nr:hypothetical protein L873DRAFT_1802027 [Choiromyces venosus 120613-1]
MASDEKSATHTLKPSASGGAFFLITGNNSSGTIWETGFISYIRSNAIGKRMNFATPGCLEDLVFAVLGTLPWLTIEEVGEIVSASGGLLLRKSKRPKIPIEKPLDYVIVGEGADAEDVEAARRLGVEVIDEQGLFDVIHDKDGMRTRRTGVTESRAERFLKALRGDKEKEEEGEGSGSGGGMADGGTNPPPQKRQETSSSSAARGGNAPIVLE